MKIDRCICTGLTFAELLATARAYALDLRGLSERTRAGQKCGYCVAYLRRGLVTGQTVFTELMEKEPL